ncbi:glutathione S-transferase [Vandammella animalimorsus]|uniref:glutathione S-transferase n=1 Tax=Vandammella animalimorsus TaxID=2029117 RepID=UPI00325B2F42
MPTASNTNAPNINAPAAEHNGGALPQLFSFRRCPYAIRARLALAAAGQAYAPIEVVLRDKPAALLAASSKGTVPVLVLPSGQVIDESLDIMLWALQRHDPHAWLQPTHGSLQAMLALVRDLDRHFKPLLDRCKYPQRHPEHALQDSRQLALQWLQHLELALAPGPWLFGQRLALADAAVFPFVRQFAAIDPPWWDAQPLPRLQAWRQRWLALPLFEQVMRKSALPGG